MTGYSERITESSKELTAREKLLLKDSGNALSLDKVAGKADSPLLINPAAYAVVDVHNEKSDNKDYKHYIILDNEGTKYVTGSNAFWDSFMEIWNTMKEEAVDGEMPEFTVQVYKMPSKNFAGDFLTCSIM